MDLDTRIAQTEAFIEGLETAMSQFTSDATGTDLRAGSKVARARDLIEKRGKPLHVTEILRGLNIANTKGNRASMAGSIAAYARRNEIFTKVGPNVFGLEGMETDEIEQEEEPAPDDSEPATIPFGRLSG